MRDLREVPADVVLLDTSPTAVVALAGDRLPPRVRRSYERYRYGPAAFKLDLAVEGGVPWTNAAGRRAGTVHVAGSLAEIVAAEADVGAGRMPARPFVLVAQQYLADPSRSAGDVHPVWVYAHVPHGYAGDATQAILAQLERFAPGVRERIVGPGRPHSGTVRGVQPELRRRRHLLREQRPGAVAAAPAAGPRPVRHRHPRRLPVLGRDAARGRRARHVRRERGGARCATCADLDR